ncbi:hypothetical protein GWI33_012535 [Rhynchophorus ferrugineus]|uniref:Uncharacterized protein n=1 Tax=Rhynchophorus ferrugineus TaxID=354439 RepID=A0A834I6B6_RHYFE|nr:hypothetical protein GWI33_012535 [Rhynchophorus ferrugineus]
MCKKKFRSLIKHCFLKTKYTVEAKTWFDAEFLDTAPGKKLSRIDMLNLNVVKSAPKSVNAVDVQKRFLPTKTLKNPNNFE